MSCCLGDYKWNTTDLILRGKKNKVTIGNVTEFSQICDGVTHTLDGRIFKNTCQVEVISLYIQPVTFFSGLCQRYHMILASVRESEFATLPYQVLLLIKQHRRLFQNYKLHVETWASSNLCSRGNLFLRENISTNPKEESFSDVAYKPLPCSFPLPYSLLFFCFLFLSTNSLK